MKLLLCAALLSLSFLSFANINHEGTCSQVTKVCAVYHTDSPFVANQEARFQLFLESSDQKEVSFVKADLWMQMGEHGHGSSPLKIIQVAPGQFDITKAYFVMKGTWQIRVTYEQDSKQETLIIPVTIKQ